MSSYRDMGAEWITIPHAFLLWVLLKDAGSIFHFDLLLGSVFLATAVMYFFVQKVKRIDNPEGWFRFFLAVVLMSLYLFDFTLPGKNGGVVPTMLIGASSLVLFELSLVVLIANCLGRSPCARGRP